MLTQNEGLPATGPITGNQLKDYRLRHGLLQADIAERTETTPRTVSGWERRGDDPLPVGALKKLRAATAASGSTSRAAQAARLLDHAADGENELAVISRSLRAIGLLLLGREESRHGDH